MSSTAIIGLIIVAIIILPIWYLIHSLGSGKRKLEKELAALWKGGTLNITEHESWGNKVIGLDREGEIAAFAIFENPHSQVFIADLQQYSKCNMEKTALDTKGKENAMVISHVLIRFVGKEKGTPDVTFPLFGNPEGGTLSNELQIAEEWTEKFNVILRKYNK